MAEIKEVPVEQIDAGPNALRLEAKDDDVDSLSASISRLGIIVPLLLACEKDRFVIVAGHRRYRAAVRLGLRTVPAICTVSSSSETKEVSFAENLFRKDLSPIEMAAGIKDTLDQGIMDLSGIAVALHRSGEWVQRMVALLSWPADVLEAIHAGWLSVSAAHNVALIDDDTYRGFLLRNAKDSGATARTTAAWLQAWRSMAPAEEAVEAPPVAGELRTTPMVPQAPCLCCSQVFRSDQLSHVPVCAGCIQAIRRAT